MSGELLLLSLALAFIAAMAFLAACAGSALSQQHNDRGCDVDASRDRPQV